MRVTCHAYAVDGWGVGELWVAGGRIVHHELATLPEPGARAAAEAPARRPRGARAPTGAELHAPRPVRADALGPAPHFGGTIAPGRIVGTAGSRVGDDFVADVCRRFAAHLSGVRVSYDDVPLDVDWATPFQADLVAALRAVPWGEVVSYGELAALAGRPRAPRAAGALCADNRFALIVPCHRVVAAGGIGGYGRAGVELKRRLLAAEGVVA